MSEKRFEVINARWEGKGEAVAFEDIQTNQVYFAENQEGCERIVELLNELIEENDKLQQIMKDIVGATDETYTKNSSIFKVTMVLDFEKYIEIRRCVE